MRVLITGASGLLGGRLAALLARRHDVVAGLHRASPPAGVATVGIDLLEPHSLESAFTQARPEAVVHCAALADADRCEREPAQAEALNHRTPAALAIACRARRIRLLTLSTDLVFGGDGASYSEADAASPLSTYARTKLAGEAAVLAEDPGAAVLRVALVVGRGHGPRGTASEAIAWGLRAGRPLRLFSDQYRTPVDAESVAAAVELLLEGRQAGLYHVGGPERLNRYELGVRVASCLGLPGDLLIPATQGETPQAALRPKDVSLDSGRAVRELGWSPRTLDEAIRDGRPGPG